MRNRIAFLLVAALFSSPVLAQSLADRVPGDAVLYVGWKGTDDPGAGYAQSHLKAMVDASNVGDLLHQTIPQLIAKYGGVDPQVGEVLRVLNTVGAAMWQHPSALYVGKLNAAKNGAPPHVLLLCRAGADAAPLQAELKKQLQQNPVPMPTTVTALGDLVVLAIDYQPNELKLPSGHDGQSLAENPAFKLTAGEVGKDPVLLGYFDASAVVSFVDQISQQPDNGQSMAKWPDMRNRLGLNELKQIAFASGFDGREWGTNVFVGCPAPRKGLLTAMDTRPLPDALLQTIPEASVIAGAGRADLAKTVEALRSAVTAFDAQIGQQVDGVFAMASQTVGVDIQQELLPTFGEEWAYDVDPTAGGKSMSSLAVINRLNDPAKAQATLAKFQAGLEKLAADQLQEKGITIAFRKVKIGDVEVNYLAVPLITPSWAIQGEYLCMGLYPQVVASAAAQIGHRGKSILTNRDFLALRTRLGGPAASSFQFMDERAMAPEGYAGWRAIASLDQIANIFGVDAPPALMPPLDLLLSHLSAGGQFAYADAKGLHVRALTSFPGADLLASDPSSMSTGQTAMMMGVMLPALQKAREQARRVKSTSNLHQIGLAAMIYCKDQKDGSFPATLGDMLPEVENNADVFLDPRRESAPLPPGLSKEDLAKWVNEHSDYVWLGKGKKAATFGADHVLAYEKLEGSTDGINILYGDGHVEFVQIDAARQQIDNARQANPNLPKNGGL